MRTSSPMLIASLLVLGLACTEAPDQAEARAAAPGVASTSTSKVGQELGGAESPANGVPDPRSDPDPRPAADPDPSAIDAEPAAEAGLESIESEPEPTPAPEPEDPLAPILPSGPEPGSPEADAELAQLLEESTLTQDEFDAAFRGSKPKIDGDQFVFGPGDRTRKSPKVTIGTPTVSGAKLTAAQLSSLAKADLRGFETCLAVALTDDATAHGAPSLRVVFDANGEASKVTVDGGTSLGAPLRECLVAVADRWKLAAAAGATGVVPLTLSSE